jgi:lipoprotein signal peptidase
MSEPSALWYALLIGVVVLSWASRFIESETPAGLEEAVSVSAVGAFVAMEYLHWQGPAYGLLAFAIVLFVVATTRRVRRLTRARGT